MKTAKVISLFFSFLIVFLQGCQQSKPEQTPLELTSNNPETPPHLKTLKLLQDSKEVIPPKLALHPVAAVYNREAIIPPQCYTRTEGKHNPCYVCHQEAKEGRENVMNDGDLQEDYSFSDLGMTNHWQNLFQDRSQRVRQISDKEILDWVNQDNYSQLATDLKKSTYKGWIPDLKNLSQGAAAFDKEGFAKDGSHWVAFIYKPFPSTFWPTNGSTDDVMIKLPEAFRSDKSGNYSKDIYKANLAIVEAKLKGLNAISSLPFDERAVGIDLDNNGKLTITTQINKTGRYVGAAEGYFIDNYLYPEGTEFLHTVRYLGINEQGETTIPQRMKEVRYMKKWKAYPKVSLARYYQEEGYEKDAGNLPGYTNLGDHGLDNGMGWSIQGFIENSQGNLRANNFEENLFCMGCHSSVGATIDKTFSFARKVDGKKGWGYINLKGMPDAPNKGESKGEIATYFERAGGGDEFRSNMEMRKRWFNADGSVNYSAIKGKDVYQLITPSKERALKLNKAYKAIVEQQTFLFGHDATVTAPENVYQSIDNKTTPTLEKEAIYDWDIRLDWQHQANNQ
jgi:hypothetical protein